MRFARARVLVLLILLMSGLVQTPAQAETLQLTVAEDKTTGYNRNAFKHWIDADKDGCDTRAEVLIEEAIEKPKIGPKCKLTGGKWLSPYDGKTITNPSQLDVDHLVPLAEAWRSGAWKWTSAQRQAYANDLENPLALVAVKLSVNRSKGDKDIAAWKPSNNLCEYARGWISVKVKYSLTIDNQEFQALNNIKSECGLDFSADSNIFPVPPNPIITVEDWREFDQNWALIKIKVDTSVVSKAFHSGISIVSDKTLVTPGVLRVNCFKGSSALQTDRNQEKNLMPGFFLSPNGINTELWTPLYDTNIFSCVLSPFYTFRISFKYIEFGAISTKSRSRNSQEFIIEASQVEPTPTPSPTPTPVNIVTPGAFCSPAGAIGKSSSEVTYTCKALPTDTRNRWRQ